MPRFNLIVHGSQAATIEITADYASEAVNDALNALSMFVCRSFPPPEVISMDLLTAEGFLVATLTMTFTIEYAAGFDPLPPNSA